MKSSGELWLEKPEDLPVQVAGTKYEEREQKPVLFGLRCPERGPTSIFIPKWTASAHQFEELPPRGA